MKIRDRMQTEGREQTAIMLFPLLSAYLKHDYKQLLLDEVFVISRIIEVEVTVISRRLRLITLSETSIILNITKTESNNCSIIH